MNLTGGVKVLLTYRNKLTGGDVAPLGAQAVTKIHEIFDWAKKSNKVYCFSSMKLMLSYASKIISPLLSALLLLWCRQSYV